MQITVIDVFRELGLEPVPSATWAVGAAVRDEFYSRFGMLPQKALRPKTDGPGSHCFAVYPEEWRPIIEEKARSIAVEAAKQPDMFGL